MCFNAPKETENEEEEEEARLGRSNKTQPEMPKDKPYMVEA